MRSTADVAPDVAAAAGRITLRRNDVFCRTLRPVFCNDAPVIR